MIIIEDKKQIPINNRDLFSQDIDFFPNIQKLIIPFIKINNTYNKRNSSSNKLNLNLKKILAKEIN